ncbi:MAG: hypothetical protein ACI865_002482 [Flavobacteriaceae bacterium]|jgi:hypothetical protein
MEINDLSPNSKLWVYKSNRPMTSDEQSAIQSELNEFIPQWAAHGNQLFGASAIELDWFVILAVDESKSLASGCSIDSSVQFIRSAGKKFNIDFFDRMHVLIENKGALENIHFSKLADYHECKIYDPMIESVAEYQSSWLVNIKESRFA